MFKLSPEASLDGSITVETKFIVDYMPYADGDYVKVYLYALSLATRKGDADDTAERLARRLNLDMATVEAAFDYWAEQGLMSKLGDEVTFLSPRTARPKIKKYDVDKYVEFNRLAQRYIAARQISPNEYNEYYALMEKLDLEWQAMVLIVKYCVDLKGDNVSYQYILTVARNLAADGYRTATDVENRLEEYGVYYNDLTAVLGAFAGGKRPDHEAVGLYKKWKLQYKFDFATIRAVAQSLKRGSVALLDSKLTGYHELGFTCYEQIEKYEAERAELYKLAKSINKALGVYYENLDPEIATYVKPWSDIGFSSDALIAIADYSMKNGLKTMNDLDAVVRDFFAAGAVTKEQVKARVDFGARYDGEIEKLMSTMGIMGAVKAGYRAYYETWANKWGFDKAVIAYAATLAVGKPFSYLNSVLSAWHTSGITTVDGAKAQNTANSSVASTIDRNTTVVERYSADELNALFTKYTDEEN